MTGERTQQVSAELEKIPAPARRQKWLLSVFGILVACIGVAMPRYLGFPWYVGTAVFGLGVWHISRDLLTKYLRFIPAFLGDVYAAIRGNGSS